MAMTRIICSECGQGNYRSVSDALAQCDVCGHEVTPRDLWPNLQTGERITVNRSGILCVVDA